MQIINVGSFHCEFCKTAISAGVYTQHPNLILEYKNEAISAVKNLHWYNNHYNCALCGKWIPCRERRLMFGCDANFETHQQYNHSKVRDSLLRLHKKCSDNLKDL